MAKSPLVKNTNMLNWIRSLDSELPSFGVSINYLRLIAYGHKQPSAKVASIVEQVSKGQVTRKELRPHDWHVIWPELIN